MQQVLVSCHRGNEFVAVKVPKPAFTRLANKSFSNESVASSIGGCGENVVGLEARTNRPGFETEFRRTHRPEDDSSEIKKVSQENQDGRR